MWETWLTLPARRATPRARATVGASVSGGNPGPAHCRSATALSGQTRYRSRSTTARDSIISTGTTKLASRNRSSGATSAKLPQRRSTGSLARDPGIEPLGDLIDIFDPKIGVQLTGVGHFRRVSRRAPFACRVDTPVHLYIW